MSPKFNGNIRYHKRYIPKQRIKSLLTKNKLGKKYHNECFLCSVCNNSLGTNYYDAEGKFQCENCYQRSIGVCGTCNRPLTGQYVKCLDKKYHESCFVCFGCRNPLPDDFYNVNGNPHCLACASK